VIYSTKAEPGKEPSQWKVVPFVDVGVGEQFQARFVALADLFNAASGWSVEQKKSIMDAFWSMVLEGFTPSFLHLRTAISLSSDPNAPILNLRNEYDGFYSKLWTAYEHRFADLVQAMGYKVRFLFAEDEAKFEKQGKKFCELHGIDKEVLTFLGEQRTAWQNNLADIRNKVVQHAQIPADAVPMVYKASNAKAYFDNCWQTAEWFTAILMARHLTESLELADLPRELTENGRKRFAIQFKPHVQFTERNS
jgi:hypothetical protein